MNKGKAPQTKLKRRFFMSKIVLASGENRTTLPERVDSLRASKEAGLFCAQCNKPISISPSRLRKQHKNYFCDMKCYALFQVGKTTYIHKKGVCMNTGRTHFKKGEKGCLSGAWKGGKIKTTYGYFYIYKPDHPFANSIGYVMEHRLVMENRIKRFLQPIEVVHHINGIKHDNEIKNLMLFSNKSEHVKYHIEERREK